MEESVTSVHRIKPKDARKFNVSITCYSLPTCFDRRRDHLQGNFQDYEEFKQTFKMHK